MSYVMERVHTDPRLRRRRKAVTRSKRRKLFVRVAVLFALLVLVWATLWSPLLNVRDVQLRGSKHTTPEDVLQVLDLGSGTNLLRLSTDEIAAQVEQLPWVKSVTVSRVLPDTLRIRIEERKAAMVLSMGAASWVVDGTGRVLASGEGKGLPVLAGTEVSGIKIGMQLEAEQLIGGLRVWRSLRPSVRKQVAAIFAPTPERITLALENGSQVRFGSPELLRAKSSVLASLLRRLEADGTTASYIDLRVPTSPAVSPVVPVAAVAPAVTAEEVDTSATTTSTGAADSGAEVSPDDSTAETAVPDGDATATQDEEAEAATSAD